MYFKRSTAPIVEKWWPKLGGAWSQRTAACVGAWRHVGPNLAMVFSLLDRVRYCEPNGLCLMISFRRIEVINGGLD